MFHVACSRGHGRISQGLRRSLLVPRGPTGNRDGRWFSILSRRWQSTAQEPAECPRPPPRHCRGKARPDELKMPVGDKNQMVVRVEGGYRQITIETLER